MRETGTAAAIGVFDSGVGGLSLLRAIHSALPHEPLIYVADSGHAPYGDRSHDFVVARCMAIARHLVARRVKAIVVACNTATVSAIDALRVSCDVPVIAIEPAVKPAVRISRNGRIGVLTTRRTADSAALAGLIERHAGGARVIVQACPGWVELVERAELDGPATRGLLGRTLAPLLEAGVDTLVLGCTHFVFLAPVLRSIVGPAVELVEPTEAVVRELARRLGIAAATADPPCGSVRFVASGSPASVRTTIGALWGAPVRIEPLSDACAPRVPAAVGEAA